MRGQTKSGGFSQNPALEYPVYIVIENDTVPVSAAINTGPSFRYEPAGYDSWIDGPHALVFPQDQSMATSVSYVVYLSLVEIDLEGQLLTADHGQISVVVNQTVLCPPGQLLTVSVEPVTLHADTAIYVEVSGFELQASVNPVADVLVSYAVYIDAASIPMVLGYGDARCLNWGLEAERIDEVWVVSERGVPEDWTEIEEETVTDDDGWTRIRGYA